jgi:hypothetical protein
MNSVLLWLRPEAALGWKLEEASTPGSPSGIGTRLKFFTGTHWCIIQPDPNTGVVVFHHGGRYTLEGNKLKTTRDFAGESTQRMIGSSGTFEIQIVGDTKKQVDADGVFHETWKRVVPLAEAEPAAEPDPEPAPEDEPCDSERLGKPADRRFRFLFGDLPWKEWLHWLADQLGMSLVMDAPPPGTFHYSGTPDFEPEQAVDLLNGVLLSKGYTLVRRERTLRLLDLSVDLPDGVVFEVPLEAVDKFGRFELVTVKFGLFGRCPEAVEAAVKPLLTPHHKIVSEPETRHLFVTDRAGVMLAVDKVIQDLPELTTPPPPREPDPPVAVVYPVTNADPEAAMTVLRELVPSGKIVLDIELNQIRAFATGAQQAMIEEVLQRMEREEPVEARPVLEVHPAGAMPQHVAQAAQLIKALKSIVPQAQITWNADRQSVIAWASAADQETIKKALGKMKLGSWGRGRPQLAVYRLHHIDPATTLSLLQSMLPDARMVVDEPTRNLIASAVPADQAVIRDMLKILQP